MSKLGPLVTLGIPTFNRANMLKRSIESALRQDYGNIEIIISDNASTDETQQIAERYRREDKRVHYHRFSHNVGGTQNFAYVLSSARGGFFMWLGDDDWIDQCYVSHCVEQLIRTPALALASGVAHYYRGGRRISTGQVFELLQNRWWRRVIAYYKQVVDNGMFYGVMRASQIKRVGLSHTMGNDWRTIAAIASLGMTKVLPEVSIHRELGGASSSPAQIAKSLGLSKAEGRFPTIALAAGACLDILRNGAIYSQKSLLTRGVVGVAVFVIIISRHAWIYVKAAGARTRTLFARAGRRL